MPTLTALPATAALSRVLSTPLVCLLASAAFWAARVDAAVVFTGCVKGADGSITCNTVPTGNTYLNDQAARYGLFQNASPGWNEFSPYQGYDEELGGGVD